MRLLFCRCWEQMCLMSSVKWRGFAEGTSLISSSIRSCRVHHLRELQRGVAKKKPQVIDSFAFFREKKQLNCRPRCILSCSSFSFAKTCAKFNKTRPPGGIVQWRGRGFFLTSASGLGGRWGTNKWAEGKREEVSVCCVAVWRPGNEDGCVVEGWRELADFLTSYLTPCGDARRLWSLQAAGRDESLPLR